MIQTPPWIRLLEAMLTDLQAYDYLAASGVANMSWRHGRARFPTDEEKPCGSLLFDVDQPREDDVQRNAWEIVRVLRATLAIDLQLASEESGLDPTGLLQLSLLAAASIQALRSPTGLMLNENTPLCDWIRVRDVAPDDGTHSDEGRLAIEVDVLYRVRSDDENVLLSPGA